MAVNQEALDRLKAHDQQSNKTNALQRLAHFSASANAAVPRDAPPQDDMSLLDLVKPNIMGRVTGLPKAIVGAGESILQMGTAMADMFFAGSSGVDALASGKSGEEATKIVEQSLGDVYQPRTDTGKNISKNIATGMEGIAKILNSAVAGNAGIRDLILGRGMDEAHKTIQEFQEEGVRTGLGSKVLESTGSPAWATLAHMFPDIALSTIGWGGGKKVAQQQTGLVKTPPVGDFPKVHPFAVRKAFIEAAPEIPALRTASSVIYKELDDMGVKIHPQMFKEMIDNVIAVGKDNRINKRTDPIAFGVTQELKKDLKNIVNRTVPDVLKLREMLGKVASSANLNERRLGMDMIDELDSLLQNHPAKLFVPETPTTPATGLASTASKYKTAEEFVKAQGKTIYHATDSSQFDAFDPSKAAKGETFFNPLGDGLFLSSNKDFTARFGKNTYEYVLPKGAKTKIITDRVFQQSEYPAAVRGTLKKLGIKYDDLDIGDKVQLNRLVENNPPIQALNEAEFVIKEDIAPKFGIKPKTNQTKDIMQGIMTERNAPYDAVIYRSTDYALGNADEIIIPKDKVPNLKTKSQLTDIWKQSQGAKTTKLSKQEIVETVGARHEVARELWGRSKRAEIMSEIFNRGDLAASGLENGLRNNLRSLLNNKNKIRYFPEAERQAMAAVVKGTTSQNMAKLIGRMGFKEGQATSALGGGLAFFVNPWLSVVGQYSKMSARYLTSRGFEFADAMVRAGKDGQEIVRAYLQTTPKSSRSVEELSAMLTKPGIELDKLVQHSHTLIREAAEVAKGRLAFHTAEAVGGLAPTINQSVNPDETPLPKSQLLRSRP